MVEDCDRFDDRIIRRTLVAEELAGNHARLWEEVGSCWYLQGKVAWRCFYSVQAAKCDVDIHVGRLGPDPIRVSRPLVSKGFHLEPCVPSENHIL